MRTPVPRVAAPDNAAWLSICRAHPKLNPLRSSRPLRDSPIEQRFQLLVDAVTDYGIFVLDPEGHIESWNTGAQRMKGYTREEILGQHFSIFYPPEAVATGWPQEELRRAAALGRFEDEGWRVRKDGTRFWANVVITALREADGTDRSDRRFYHLPDDGLHRFC